MLTPPSPFDSPDQPLIDRDQTLPFHFLHYTLALAFCLLCLFDFG